MRRRKAYKVLPDKSVIFLTFVTSKVPNDSSLASRLNLVSLNFLFTFSHVVSGDLDCLITTNIDGSRIGQTHNSLTCVRVVDEPLAQDPAVMSSVRRPEHKAPPDVVS